MKLLKEAGSTRELPKEESKIYRNNIDPMTNMGSSNMVGWVDMRG